MIYSQWEQRKKSKEILLSLNKPPLDSISTHTSTRTHTHSLPKYLRTQVNQTRFRQMSGRFVSEQVFIYLLCARKKKKCYKRGVRAWRSFFFFFFLFLLHRGVRRLRARLLFVCNLVARGDRPGGDGPGGDGPSARRVAWGRRAASSEEMMCRWSASFCQKRRRRRRRRWCAFWRYFSLLFIFLEAWL